MTSKNVLRIVLLIALALVVMTGMTCWAQSNSIEENFCSSNANVLENFTQLKHYCDPMFSEKDVYVTITSVATKGSLVFTNQLTDNVVTRPLLTNDIPKWELVPYKTQSNIDTFPRNTKEIQNCVFCIKLAGTNKKEPSWYLTQPNTKTNSFKPRPTGSLFGCGPNQQWYLLKVNSSFLKPLYQEASQYVERQDLDNLYIIASKISVKGGTILSVPPGLSDTVLKGGDIDVYMDSFTSSITPRLASLWIIKKTKDSPTQMKPLQLPMFAPTSAIDDYPDHDFNKTGAGVWMPEFGNQSKGKWEGIWNHKFHYISTSDLSNPSILTIQVKPDKDSPYGKGTVSGMWKGNSNTWNVQSYGSDFLSGVDTKGNTRLTLHMVSRKRKGSSYPENTNFLQGWVKDIENGTVESLCGHEKLNMAGVCAQMIKGNSWQDYFMNNDLTPINVENNIGIPKDLYHTVVIPKPPYDDQTALDDYWVGQYWDMQKDKTYAGLGSNPIAGKKAISANDCASYAYSNPVSQTKGDRFTWNPTTKDCMVFDKGPSPQSSKGDYSAVLRYPRTDILGDNRLNFTKDDINNGQATLSQSNILEDFVGTVGNINDCLKECNNEVECDQLVYNMYDKSCKTGFGGAEVSSTKKGDVVYSYVGTRNQANATTKKNFQLHGQGSSYTGGQTLNTKTYTGKEMGQALNECATLCQTDPDCRMWTLKENDKQAVCETQCSGTLTNDPSKFNFAGKKKVYTPTITDKSILNNAIYYPSGGNQLDKSKLESVPNAFNYPMENVCSLTSCAKSCQENPWCNLATFNSKQQECMQYVVQGDYDQMAQQAQQAHKNSTNSSNPVATYLSYGKIPANIQNSTGISNDMQKIRSEGFRNKRRENYSDFTTIGINNELSGGYEISQSNQPTLDACVNECRSQVSSGCNAVQWDEKSKVCFTKSMEGSQAQMKAPSIDQGTYALQMSAAAQAKEFATISNLPTNDINGPQRSSENRCDYVCAKDWYGDLKKKGWKGGRSVSYALDEKGNRINADQPGASQCVCYRDDDAYWYRRGLSANQDPNTQWVMDNNGTCDCNTYCAKDWNDEMSKTYTLVDNNGQGVGSPWTGARAEQSNLGTILGTSIPNNVAPALGSGGIFPTKCLCRQDNNNKYLPKGSGCAVPETQTPYVFNFKPRMKLDGHVIDTDMGENVVAAQDKCGKNPQCTGFVLQNGQIQYMGPTWEGRENGGNQAFQPFNSKSPITGSYIKSNQPYMYQAYSSSTTDLNTAAPSYISQNINLKEGNWLMSPNKAYILVFQTDGNLVIYRRSNFQSLWATGTNGQGATKALIQSDGNLVVYNNNTPLWSSSTQRNVPNAVYTLSINNNGQAIITSSVQGVIWSS